MKKHVFFVCLKQFFSAVFKMFFPFVPTLFKTCLIHEKITYFAGNGNLIWYIFNLCIEIYV